MDLEERVDAAYEASIADEAKDTNEDKADESTEEADDTKTKEDESDAKSEEDKPDDSDDKDEELDEDDEEAIEEAKVKVEELPPINKYIYENLPELVTSGVMNGKDVTIKVKTANEIPEGFEWKSKRDEKIFDQSLIDQGVKATNLSNEYDAKQRTAEGDKFRQAEANDIQSDLKELQAEGLIPKFSTATANSNPEHPGVKLANEVLELYTKVNGSRLEKWQKAQAEGRNTLYRSISYRDAFEKHQAKQSDTKAEDKKAATTKDRKEATAKIGGGRGASDVSKPMVRRGMTVDDILEAHEGDFE